MPVPTHGIVRVKEAHRRLIDAVSVLTDEQLRRPSLLPGWTVAHVLSHLARNADSHTRRAAAAQRGEMVDQYGGGPAGRSNEIEDSARQDASELAADVQTSCLGVEESWDRLREVAWSGRTRDANGLTRPLFELPARRWQEVEVHLVDLDIGTTHRNWGDEFVLMWLPRTRERMARTLREIPDPDIRDGRDELAWLYGRLKGEGLPELPAWG